MVASLEPGLACTVMETVDGEMRRKHAGMLVVSLEVEDFRSSFLPPLPDFPPLLLVLGFGGGDILR